MITSDREAKLFQDYERVCEALENSQSLLVAILHEKRPDGEIEAQIIENRTALSSQACAGAPGMSLELSMTELELAMRKLANTVKLDTIEACAKIVEPKGPRPCDCERCDCHNQGDAEAVAAWDADAAAAKAIRALSLSRPDRAPPSQNQGD